MRPSWPPPAWTARRIVWDAQTGQALYTLAGHEGRVNLALWSPDGSQLATAGEDGMLRIWNAADGELLRSIETNAGAVISLAWAPNSVRIVSGHGDGSLRIWEIASGKLLETLRGHQGMVSDLKWSPVDDRLASARWQRQCARVERRAQHRLAVVPAPGCAGRRLDRCRVPAGPVMGATWPWPAVMCQRSPSRRPLPSGMCRTTS